MALSFQEPALALGPGPYGLPRLYGNSGLHMTSNLSHPPTPHVDCTALPVVVSTGPAGVHGAYAERPAHHRMVSWAVDPRQRSCSRRSAFGSCRGSGRAARRRPPAPRRTAPPRPRLGRLPLVRRLVRRLRHSQATALAAPRRWRRLGLTWGRDVGAARRPRPRRRRRRGIRIRGIPRFRAILRKSMQP